MKKQTLKNSLLQKKRISKFQLTKVYGGFDGKKTLTRNGDCDTTIG